MFNKESNGEIMKILKYIFGKKLWLYNTPASWVWIIFAIYIAYNINKIEIINDNALLSFVLYISVLMILDFIEKKIKNASDHTQGE